MGCLFCRYVVSGLCVFFEFWFVCMYCVFCFFFFFSSRRRHTRYIGDWSQTCALPICQGGRHVREPVHRAAGRRGSGGDGRDPRGAGHLRQLPARDGDPGRLDPPPPSRGGGGDDRRGRGDAAPGRPQKAAAASAHRPWARAVSGGLDTEGGAREGRGLTYLSPLGQRYASPAMQALWGERRRVGLWRRLWLALMEAPQELGPDIPDR